MLHISTLKDIIIAISLGTLSLQPSDHQSWNGVDLGDKSVSYPTTVWIGFGGLGFPQ